MLDFIVYKPKSIEGFGFYEEVEAHKNKTLIVKVYNMVTQKQREVKVVPNLKWGGKTLLGADVRYEDYTFAHCTVYYVAEVKPNSPASKANLLPGSDYIVGAKDMVFSDLDDIGMLLLSDIHLTIAIFRQLGRKENRSAPSYICVQRAY